VLHPGKADPRNLLQAGWFLREKLASRWPDRRGLPPVLRAGRANPTLRFEARDCVVKSAGTQPDACKRLNILHDGVTVFIAFGEAQSVSGVLIT
jgi:hypothetical protein